jgi:hypothetical protein
MATKLSPYMLVEMTKLDSTAWAQSFAADLTVLGERVPFERAMRPHVAMIDALLAQGLTWTSLARILFRAGATRGNGRAYSGDHLRVARTRIKVAQGKKSSASLPPI